MGGGVVVGAMFKLREKLFSTELALSLLLMLITWIGMAVSLAGLHQLPKCQHGDPDCFFFVQVCGESLLNESQAGLMCTWISKTRKIESNSGSGLDKVALPVAAPILGVIPAITLVFSTVVRNERTVLSVLEFGKLFIGFVALMLIVSNMMIDRLTWDCRWWGEHHHPDGDACKAGYVKYALGTIFLFTSMAILFCGIIVWTEVERKRVSGGGTRTDVVQM